MNELKRFVSEEDGMAVVEVVLIIVVLIAVVIIFRDEITSLVEDIFDTIGDDVENV